MSEFELFIDKITDPKLQQERENKIEFYQSKVSEFFKTILKYLNFYIEKGKISYKLYDNWDIKDADLGKFYVQWTKIKMGIYDISLIPHSPSLVGAFGRIDMTCRNNHVMFVLTYKKLDDISEISEIQDNQLDKDDLVWKYVEPSLSGKMKELTEEVFLKALIKVVNGN